MRAFLLLIFGVVGWSSVVAAGDTQYARPELLQEPTELAKPDMSKQFVILDTRSPAEYDLGHVPGARRVDHDAWKKTFGEGKDAERWSKAIGELGIGRDSKVVVYDDKGMKDAARIWWILKYWSIEDARLLNGGWKGWKSSALHTTEARPAVASPTDFKAIPRSKRLATMSQVLGLLQGNGLQIVDARSEDEFCGLDKRDNKRGGAIPGAKHLEWSDLIDQETQRFKSPAQLRGLFDQAGIDLGQSTASHCNGGGRAAVMAFGLELMGAKDVRNYYRGWSEWSNAEDTPVSIAAEKETKKVSRPLSFTMKSLNGKDVDLSQYQGKVVMIVNVASKCGLTPQYEQLQALHKKYSKDGLAILGFPCNQFLSQEPGTAEEIKEFCRVNYGVSFDMFSKIEVNGDGACELYKSLTVLDTTPVGPGKISWNFEKFIISRHGEVIARFAPKTKPDDNEVLKVIEEELAKK